jgi:hypothetical protein
MCYVTTDTDMQAEKMKKVKNLPSGLWVIKTNGFHGLFEALPPLSES